MKKRLRRILWVIGSIAGLFIVAGVIFCGYQAIRNNRTLALPRPTGAYHVGRKVYDWTDPNRTNAFAGKPDEPRELMVAIWYPTDEAASSFAPYIPHPWLEKARKAQGVLGNIFSHNPEKIQTNSIPDATLSKTRQSYPIVIFEPGFGRSSFDYTVIAENLASHGYIVISSTPTYLADLVVFNDGREATGAQQAALPENGSSLDPAVMDKIIADREVYDGDIAFLLQEVSELNSTDEIWGGRMEISRIALAGHSLGGASAYHVCLTDTRCKAAIDLDGTLFGESDSVNRVPFAFFSSDKPNNSPSPSSEAAYNQHILADQQEPFQEIVFKGFKHFNFSDLALTTPLARYLGALGSVDGAQGLKDVNSKLLEFLAGNLR